MVYLLHVLVLFALYSSFAISLDMFVGKLGIISLCHITFIAVGAYGTAILLKNNVPLLISWLASGALTLLLIPFFSVISRRLRHDTLILATLAVFLIISELIENLRGITGGLNGISGIHEPSIFFLTVNGEIIWFLLTSLYFMFSYYVVIKVSNSSIGRCMRAFRDQPALAVSLGVNPSLTLSVGIGISAVLAALGGGLFGVYLSYISPSTFGFEHTVLILTMVLIGGADTKLGPVLGAVLLVSFPELLRVIGFSSTKVGSFQQTFFGLILLIFTLWKPRGILKGFKF
jgi:ABC-type branched-subunit amino acid transport system permease subunit